jgi:glucosamine--fructose-6-phosphate aminotransferase (isomerizing)
MTQPTSPLYHTIHEITDQPEAWVAALALLDAQQEALRAFFTPTPSQLLFVGCGSPFFLARSAASQSRAITGIDSHSHPGSDIWLFPDQTLTPSPDQRMIVITRSGETTELLRAVETYRARGGQGVAVVTCYPDSALAKVADLVLAVPEAQEVGLAQTRSFTTMLLLTQGLIHAIVGKPLSAAFRNLPSAGRRLIAAQENFGAQFGNEMSSRFKRYYFLGGGALYGIACEAMLKMKEMSLSMSEAYQFMEFRHGPMSMANPETLIIGMVSEAAFDYETAVMTEMRQRGATVLALTPRALPADSADYQVVLPEGLDDIERAALYLPTLHQIIYAHTLRKGLDPDLPNNLTAVIHLDGVNYTPEAS